jgi:type II secretory pathway component GspD/PulD (secretin)
VFLLRKAKATDVATTLQTLFKTTPAGRRPGSAASTLVAIPDERLNALVVQANRADLPTVENLVRMLDTTDVPNSTAGDRMKLIPVENTSAVKIQQVLQTRFKTADQSIGVEEQSNSLVVIAPAAVAEQIARFVKELDEAAGAERSQRIKLLQLHSTNSQEIQSALDAILTKKGSSTSRSTTPRASSAWPASSTWTLPASSGGSR